MSPSHDQDADCHFAASFVAAIINFPLWRASAIAQSGINISLIIIVLIIYTNQLHKDLN